MINLSYFQVFDIKSYQFSLWVGIFPDKFRFQKQTSNVDKAYELFKDREKWASLESVFHVELVSQNFSLNPPPNLPLSPTVNLPFSLSRSSVLTHV